MKKTKPYVALLLVAAIAAGVAGCATSAKAADLMKNVSPSRVSGKPADDAFAASVANFSVELFKKGVTNGENSLISPLSVMLALAMTANGADGETLSQMETLLGGGIPLDEMNEYLYKYADSLPSGSKAKLSIANSIWLRDDKNMLKIAPEFLQTNADYYGAAAYRSAFDAQTVKDINNWVKSNTGGMIEAIIDKIDSNDMMYLINAIAFDAEWKEIYKDTGVREGVFTDIRGNEQKVDFMHSVEGSYLDDGMAVGFVKPYVSGYSFAALLPNEGITIDAYIDSLTGGGFLDTLANAQRATVQASMPKFKFEYSIDSMKGILAQMGMPDAFSERLADFHKMGTSSSGELYIGDVIHKTFIAIDERGTKAGAATAVVIRTKSAIDQAEKTVNLDRPFVYAIIDNATNLPVFIGTTVTLG